jgi:hypothetical protein
MSREENRQIRTRKYNIRIGDLEVIDGLPVMLVKRNGIKDIYTLRELIVRLYGEHSHCVIFDENGTQFKF